MTASIIDLAHVRTLNEKARESRTRAELNEEAGDFSSLLQRAADRYRLDPKVLAILLMSRAVEFLSFGNKLEPGSVEEYRRAATLLKAVVHARADRKDEAVRLLTNGL